MDCPQGYEYVSAHRKADGTYVKGYCRPTQAHDDTDDTETEDFAEL